MDYEWDADLLRKAGLQPRALSMIIGVHRVTAAKWLTKDRDKRGSPHALLEDRAARLMRAVRLGLEDGILPVQTKDLQTFQIDAKTIEIVEQLMEDVKE